MKLTSIHFPTREFGSRIYVFEREEFCLGYPVYSSLLVCPICCETWARISIEDSRVYEPRMVSCVKCKWWHKGHEHLHPVPGSLIDNWTCGGVDWPMLDSMPEGLLRRELELTLRAWDAHPW